MRNKIVAVMLSFILFSMVSAQISKFDFEITDIHNQQHNCADYLKAGHWILVDITKNN